MSGVTNTQQEEDKKPNDQSAHINLKVKGQVGWFLSGGIKFMLEGFNADISSMCLLSLDAFWLLPSLFSLFLLLNRFLVVTEN